MHPSTFCKAYAFRDAPRFVLGGHIGGLHVELGDIWVLCCGIRCTQKCGETFRWKFSREGHSKYTESVRKIPKKSQVLGMGQGTFLKDMSKNLLQTVYLPGKISLLINYHPNGTSVLASN